MTLSAVLALPGLLLVGVPGADAAAGARPTEDIYTAPEATPVCRAGICVHYAQDGTNDVPTEDDGAGGTWKGYADNGIPDLVDLLSASILPKVAKVFTDAGYKPPVGDGTAGGGTDQVDLYLADLADVDGGAYCVTDGPDEAATAPGWCVLDNDYSSAEYSTRISRAGHLGLDAVHQYSLLVSRAYSLRGNWLTEAAATWVEDEVYPDLNRNRAYLPFSALSKPLVPVGRWPSFYEAPHQAEAAWVFLRFLSERYPARSGPLPVIVRHLWEHVGEAPNYFDFYDLVLYYDLNLGLAQHDTTVDDEFIAFTTWNRQPGRYYDEGAAYPTAPLAASTVLTRAAPTKVFRDKPFLNSLTSATLRYRPGSSLTGAWRLRVRAQVDAWWADEAVTATIKVKGRAPKTRVILPSDVNETVVDLPFTSQVEWVDITVVGLSQKSHSDHPDPPAWYYTITAKALRG